jgi:hypothetical protein
MRKAFYRQKLEFYRPPESKMPFIRGRALECAISRHLLARDPDLELHKRYEKGGVLCYTDLSNSRTIIEIKDTIVGRRLTPEHSQFKGYLMQGL